MVHFEKYTILVTIFTD